MRKPTLGSWIGWVSIAAVLMAVAGTAVGSEPPPIPVTGTEGATDVRQKLENLLGQSLGTGWRPKGSGTAGQPGSSSTVSAGVLPVDLGAKDVSLPGPGDPRPRDVQLVPRVRRPDAPSVDVDIPFVINSAALQKAAFSLLDQVSAVLLRSENGTTRVAVNGHTDRVTGTYLYNMRLSQLRALSVMRYLAAKGVPAHRLEGYGYGPNRLKYDDRTPEGQQRNRRVEFELLEGRRGND
ncbi:MAG: OmpA family protein [Candidatus Riflebacteria bacterium]|nr:OmpA family protein [Candidatus Riflebacteria bacterium]